MDDVEEFLLITQNGEDYHLKSVDLNNTSATNTSSSIQYEAMSKAVENNIKEIYVPGNGDPTTVIEDNDKQSTFYFAKSIILAIVDRSVDVSEISQRLYDTKLSCKSTVKTVESQLTQPGSDDVSASEDKGALADTNLHSLSQCADGGSLETPVKSPKEVHEEECVTSNNNETKIENQRGNLALKFALVSGVVALVMMARK